MRDLNIIEVVVNKLNGCTIDDMVWAEINKTEIDLMCQETNFLRKKMIKNKWLFALWK